MVALLPSLLEMTNIYLMNKRFPTVYSGSGLKKGGYEHSHTTNICNLISISKYRIRPKHLELISGNIHIPKQKAAFEIITSLSLY